MKIETKLNIATAALAAVLAVLALCASAVTADWDAVKRLVGDATNDTLQAAKNYADQHGGGGSGGGGGGAVDPTLTTNGVPADAKATGDALALKVSASVSNGYNEMGVHWDEDRGRFVWSRDGLDVFALDLLGYFVGCSPDWSWLVGSDGEDLGQALQGKIDRVGWATNGYIPIFSNSGMLDESNVNIDDVVTKDDLVPVADDARNAYLYSRAVSLYMTGSTNAWFAGTNYVFGADAATRRRFAWEQGMDAATVPCSMALWEIRDGAKQCVWDQRDWPTWYWSFKAAQMRSEFNASNAVLRADVNAAISAPDNHAWARRYASTGRVNPDPSTTFIDTPSVCLSPGMNWETVATVDGCGYWTVVGNGAVIGGSGTNAVLNIKDFEGNSILQISKGEHRLAWLSSADFVSQMTDANGWVCFDMRADVQPTGYFSTTLDLADFVEGSDADCPAQFTWENRGGGVWRVHFLLKPGIVSDTCFAKFQVEVEGKTQIRYNADTVVNGGLIYDGVKIAPVIPSGAAVGSTVTWKVVQ